MLYVVATPIGNLSDISQRALDVLADVDFVLCEDTRVTRKLLERYGLDKKMISYHQHTGDKKTAELTELIKKNKVALVTDAGTPVISDPGGKIIEKLVVSGLGKEISPIPGPSVVAAALSVAGFVADKFLFLGFIPHKKGRNKFLKRVAESQETVVFFESPYRAIKCLEQLKEVANNKQLVVCRELTKKFETIYRGRAEEVLSKIKSDFPTGKPRGEFVFVFSPSR